MRITARKMNNKRPRKTQNFNGTKRFPWALFQRDLGNKIFIIGIDGMTHSMNSLIIAISTWSNDLNV